MMEYNPCTANQLVASAATHMLRILLLMTFLQELQKAPSVKEVPSGEMLALLTSLLYPMVVLKKLLSKILTMRILKLALSRIRDQVATGSQNRESSKLQEAMQVISSP